eukprot:745605-Hanusia_phi.AAC.2
MSAAKKGKGKRMNQEEDAQEPGSLKVRDRKKSKSKNAANFGDALRNVLNQKVPSNTITPILAGAKQNKELKERLKEEKEQKENQTLSVAKKKWFSKEHVLPTDADLNHEKLLHKLATKGVVKLFNAIQEQQRKRVEESNAEKKTTKTDKVSKKEFLDMLKSGGKEKDVSGTAQPDSAAQDEESEDSDGDEDVSRDDAGENEEEIEMEQEETSDSEEESEEEFEDDIEEIESEEDYE